jgi:hypothetical protein
MTTTASLRGALIAVTWLAIGMSAANAQATRTWVSGVGDDANPCSRTAPCKTFAGAISKTLAGGEIDALDPGGFGAVTITKAITIDGGGGQVASVLVSGTNAIVVQAGASDVVTLRNSRLNGIGTGINGIRFLSGRAIHIQSCYIFRFNIVSAGQVNIADTVVFNNLGGIRISTSGAGNMLAALERVQVNNNGSFGLRGEGSGGAGAVVIEMTDSQAANNNNGVVSAGNIAAVGIVINRSAIVNNATNGLQTTASGQSGVIFVGNSTIAGNGTGVNASAGGVIFKRLAQRCRCNSLKRRNLKPAFLPVTDAAGSDRPHVGISSGAISVRAIANDHETRALPWPISLRPVPEHHDAASAVPLLDDGTAVRPGLLDNQKPFRRGDRYLLLVVSRAGSNRLHLRVRAGSVSEGPISDHHAGVGSVFDNRASARSGFLDDEIYCTKCWRRQCCDPKKSQ